MRFDPNHEDVYYTWRDELVARFESMPAGQDRGWIASQVLDFKATYLDGDLSRWTTRDVDEILLELYPAKVMLDENDLDLVPEMFAETMRFLGTEGIIDSTQATRLATHISSRADKFRRAVGDESNWSFGKQLWAQASAEGVEIGDGFAMEQFVQAFNARPFDERDAILGGHVGSPTPSRLRPLPPMVLAPQHELDTAASETPVIRRLQALVEYVGGRRPLTPNGNLKLADGKELIEILGTDDEFDGKIGDRVFKTKSTVELSGVDRIFRLAVACGFLSLDGNAVERGKTATQLAEWPLEALFSVLERMLDDLGPSDYHWRDEEPRGPTWYVEELNSYLTDRLIDLYRHGAETIPDLIEDAWEHLGHVFVLDDVPQQQRRLERMSIEYAMWRALDRLSDFGIISMVDVEEVVIGYGRTDRVGGSAELTDLGKWAVQRLASRFTSAPVIGALRNTAAIDLLTSAADLPEADAAAEIALWVADHGDVAAELLVSELPAASPTARRLGFEAMRQIGPLADQALDSLAKDPELAPYVAVWRAGDPEDANLDCAGDAERFIRLTHAAVELHGPEAAGAIWADAAAGSSGLVELLNKSWRIRLPETEEVLATIGAHHHTKTTAKTARQALFKHRTAT